MDEWFETAGNRRRVAPPSIDQGNHGIRVGQGEREVVMRREPNRDDRVRFFGAACSFSSSTPLEAYLLYINVHRAVMHFKDELCFVG